MNRPEYNGKKNRHDDQNDDNRHHSIPRAVLLDIFYGRPILNIPIQFCFLVGIAPNAIPTLFIDQLLTAGR